MRFDDFLAQGHATPEPWAWGVQITIPKEGGDGKDFVTVWRHSISSTKAEAEQFKRETIAAGWLRSDARLRVVKVVFDIQVRQPKYSWQE